MGFFGKLFSREKKQQLDSGLQKTKEGMWGKICLLYTSDAADDANRV